MLKAILIDPMEKTISPIRLNNNEDVNKALNCTDWGTVWNLTSGHIILKSRGKLRDQNEFSFLINDSGLFCGRALVCRKKKYWMKSCKLTIQEIKRMVYFPMYIIDGYTLMFGLDKWSSQN